MNISKKTLEVIKKVEQYNVFNLFEQMDKINQGINFILVYLYEKKKDLSAGELAKALKVSTARIAVLIKKLISRKFVIKYSNPVDARITMVSLTAEGLKYAHKEKENSINKMSKIIEKVGLDEFEKFLKTALKMKEVIKSVEI